MTMFVVGTLYDKMMSGSSSCIHSTWSSQFILFCTYFIIIIADSCFGHPHRIYVTFSPVVAPARHIGRCMVRSQPVWMTSSLSVYYYFLVAPVMTSQVTWYYYTPNSSTQSYFVQCFVVCNHQSSTRTITAADVFLFLFVFCLSSNYSH